MKLQAYIETSVVSYLTARQNPDPIATAHRLETQYWWEVAEESFLLVASELVIQEASAGDPAAAWERLAALSELKLLEVKETAVRLAEKLVQTGAIPAKAVEDALHIAICATHGVEYLVTWNCRHIANATKRGQIESVCRAANFEPPILCTPSEMGV